MDTSIAHQFAANTRNLDRMRARDIRLLGVSHFYFAYGPHMSARHMGYFVPDAIRLGPAVLRGWRLVLAGPASSSEGATARIEQTGGSDDVVQGVVYELSASTKARLCMLEQGPYQELAVTAESDDWKQAAFAFVRLRGMDIDHTEYSPSDLQIMINGAEENKFFDLATRLRQLYAACDQTRRRA
jgi:hypothetical protein